MIRIFCDMCGKEVYGTFNSRYSISLPNAKERESGHIQPLEQRTYDHVCENCYVDIAKKLGLVKYFEREVETDD